MEQRYSLVGYIAGDTFSSKGNSHFADQNGKVVCGTKNRFGMDCSIEIRIVSYTEFYTDQTISFKTKSKLAGTPLDLNRNHIPIDCFITCKKCQDYIEKNILRT